MKALLIVLALLSGSVAQAADIIVIGEVHDNPDHHQVQADTVAARAPKALVFEMITRDQAAALTPADRASEAALGEALDWATSGWPDFTMYYPIFAAAPEARIYGALVPAPGKAALRTPGLTAYLDEVAQKYRLDQPPPPDQQTAREALQMAAHCGALPPEALPGIVAFQRLRDAALADAALEAIAETGGPVAVITGNGHARRDWGMPALLAAAAPELHIEVIGQTEEGRTLEGGFDRVLSAPAVDRPDPCAAFQ